MTLDYILGRPALARADRLSRLRAAAPGKVLRAPMTLNGWLQILLFFVVDPRRSRSRSASTCTACSRAPNRPLPRVLGAGRALPAPPVRRAARTKRRPGRSTRSTLLAFSAFGVLVTYALQRLQHVLPFNPQDFGAVAPHSSFNTAVSFTTNTNWQGYAGEATMSYLTQMAGLAWHNFISAAPGIASPWRSRAASPAARERARRRRIGNFWVDLMRSIVYVLLPISSSSPWSWSPGRDPEPLALLEVTTLEGAKQMIAMGPVASQEAIKELGTNGGGFFNANSAHPFENPTPLTNFLEMFLIFAIPAALTYTFGRMARNQRQGWALFGAMAFLFFVGVAVAYCAEASANPRSPGCPSTRASGNMEGKEVRFGVANSALFATVTTDASCGAVNAMHDSFTPLGGLVPLVNIKLGEVIFGGVGAGPLRHAGHGAAVGLHRRPDGGPHARVPGQEDRGARDEARDALRADLPADHPGLRGLGGGRRLRHDHRSTTPARTA